VKSNDNKPVMVAVEFVAVSPSTMELLMPASNYCLRCTEYIMLSVSALEWEIVLGHVWMQYCSAK